MKKKSEHYMFFITAVLIPIPSPSHLWIVNVILEWPLWGQSLQANWVNESQFLGLLQVVSESQQALQSHDHQVALLCSI